MIAKEIKVSITNTYLKNIRLHRGKHEWADTGGLISNDGHTMLYVLFKTINPATRIDVGNNVKYLFDYMSSNNSIIVNRG